MKIAFFLVLLANLTFLMLQYHRGAFERATEATAPDPALLRETIMLAREQEGEAPPTQDALAAPVQALAATEAAPPSVQQPTAPAISACYEAGPFASEQLLKLWNQKVGEAQGELRPVPHQAQAITDYLVLYPTAGSPEAIKAAVQSLRDQGVGDAYPLAVGEYKGYISLGAFHRETRAARMQKDLQERGIEAVVKPRFKDSMQKYALIKGPSAIAGALETLGKQYPAVQLKALPDHDPLCREESIGQAPAPAVQPGENEMQPRILQAPQNDGTRVASAGAVRSGMAPSDTGNSAEQKPPVQPAAQAAQKDAVDREPVRLVCYEAGPFPNEQSLGLWQQQVSGAQAAVKPVSRDGKVVSDYLVLYPATGGAEETKAAIKLLRERGLNDVWPLPSGEDKGQISLGVFNREENAAEMQKNLLAQGIQAVVKPRYKSKPQKYALVTAPESIADDLKALEKKHPGIKLRRVPDAEQPCP
jgi:cell division septation protein DedD